MARLSFSPERRGQFAAIARLRWRLFVNSLRTIRGRLELVSRIFMFITFSISGVGAAIGLGAASWYFVSHGKAEWLALLLWPVMMFWQLFPMMATAFTENIDSSHLLRFPLSYPSYFLVRMAYGSFDPATALGSLWLTGMAVGITYAEPRLFFWAAAALLAFAVFNILLGRLIFAWVERWLAQRRTREILGIAFFLFFISFQFIGPLMDRYGHGSRLAVARFTSNFLPFERLLPPGLAAGIVAQAKHGGFAIALGGFALLLAYGLAIFWLLNLRLRAQYLGENLSEAVARSVSPQQKVGIQLGWGVRGLSGPVAAIFEKEFRYLSRSGPMLFTLVMPIFILVIFRLAPSGSGRGDNFLLKAPDLAFPVGAAYALLILTNLVYNNFGADAGGVQFFFVSPVRFHEILVAKNLAHAGVLAIDTALVWFAVSFMFRPPSWGVTLATLAGILFALPVNLAAGNLLSLYSPKKFDFATFGRQRAPGMTVLASFGIQLTVFALAALTLLVARYYGRIWLAAVVFLVLAALAFAGYLLILDRTDKIALKQREILISELCRA